MNKVFLVGRLTADPLSSVTTIGTQQARITVATNNNKQKDETFFFPCIAWGNPANFINTFLKKGELVAIDGQLTRRSYVSKQSGQTVYNTEIVIDSINSIGSKKLNETNEFAQASTIEPKKSIDEAFGTNVVTNKEASDQKIATPKFDNNNDEIEWFDEINKGEK